MYSWPKMKNLKSSFHVKVRKVEISVILIRGSFKRFEDSVLLLGLCLLLGCDKTIS